LPQIQFYGLPGRDGIFDKAFPCAGEDIIVGLFSWGGLTISAITSVKGAIVTTITVVVITLVCIFGILYISKWGGVKK